MTIRYQHRNQPFHSFLSTDNTYPLHLHKNVELAMILSGQIRITANQQDFVLTDGDVAVIFPNQPHGYRTEEHSRMMLALVDPAFIGEYAADLVNYVPDHPVVPQSQVPPHITEIFHILHNLYVAHGDNRLIKAYTSVVMGSLLPLLSLKRRESNPDLSMIQKLLVYLETHFLEPISLDTLSKELGISKFMISRIFSEQLRTSFRDYVNGRRAALAQAMLQSTTYPVTDIAFDCGFNSLRSFYRAFKKEYGVTPNEVRRNG
ncbi:helix-turn-helix domain-containing protein [Paenibacillus chartarius]|uniref:Helix-turn-helix domain-containing protein n=1 Tax=Paenibacillus chartarius TaxID=747481 RepID=A0ABV6DSW3_9BACL